MNTKEMESINKMLTSHFFFQNTALHLAAMNGHGAAVALLMTLNASFLQNNERAYFIDYAIDNRHKEVTMSIISHDR
jgi:ankyrin repeat protein